MKLTNVLKEAAARGDLLQCLGEYERRFGGGSRGGRNERKSHYRDFVGQYYNLASDLYEFGWGRSFHFSGRWKDESFAAALKRLQHNLADALELEPGMVAADLGCGIGGPMQEIARYSGAKIVGINSSAYQLRRATQLSRESDVDDQLEFLECDFSDIDAPDASYDAVYSIQSLCCVPDVSLVYAEAFRILKPGGRFATYEYSLTDQYDEGNAEHRRIKDELEYASGFPETPRQCEIDAALHRVGFELLAARDLTVAFRYEIPWYEPLAGSRLSLAGFLRSAPGRKATNAVLWLLEWLRILPRGTGRVAELLNQGADAHVEAGVREIFTPEYAVVARKPHL
ncbi:MAG: methyltransferase domain-containing protein [Gammaproteobacteria bacterium]|nr:methyltransferase domain-containing protein [Gammaproteobacteria bacterium]